MKDRDRDRDRQWHDELSDLVAEEATEHLSRLRGSLAAKRAERKSKEDARQREKDEKERRQAAKFEAKRKREAEAEANRKYDGLAALPTAWVFALAALVSSGIAVFGNEVWILWMSLGFALVSAQKFGSHSRAKALLAHERMVPELAADTQGQPIPAARARGGQPQRETAPVEASKVPADPLEQRIEEACQRLERALAESPKQVRDFLSMHPKRTLTELRASARDFQKRERALRALSAPEARARVQADDDALQARIARATDEAVRSSLLQARAALQQKQAYLDELQRSADRLEAERMRLGYTLEGLLAQVLRLQYADGVLASDELPVGLREGLEKLHGELSALAEASEAVGRIEEEAAQLQPIAEFEAPDADASGRQDSRVPERG